MKYAADFRRTAREALKGRWSGAVITGLVASILGGASSGGVNFNFNFNFENNELQSSSDFGQITYELENMFAGLLPILIGVVSVVFVVALAVGIAYAVLGSIVGVGYSRYNLTLLEREREPEIGELFTYFKNWKTIAVTGILRGLYTFLWSLLFVIPGIIVSYNYAMVPYILTENPELPAREALARSKEMMLGNRWRLFCLQCSFLGWSILNLFTLGIGSLWLVPYTKAAEADFFREISMAAAQSPYGEEPWQNT